MSDALSLDALLDPIAGALPAGQDGRLDARHELLRAELGKLSALQGEPPDWSLVESQGSSLLRESSKDLLIAVYVASAFSVRRGVAGTTDGCSLVSQLMTRFGASLHPQRPRARAGALQWYVEWLARVLEAAKPQSQAEVEALRTQVRALRDATGELLGADGPSFSPLLASCERLALSVPAPPQPPPSPASSPVVPSGASSPVAAHADALPAAAVLPESHAAPVSSLPTKTTQATSAVPSTVQSTDEGVRYTFGVPPTEGQPLLSYVLRTGAVLVDLARARFEADRADPRSYRWLRMGLWLRWERAPAGNRLGRTDVTGPSPARRGELQRALQGEDWEALLILSEQLLAKNPLWLDCNRASALALEKLGDRFAPAHAHVVTESRALASRLHGITQVTFADGSAFASEQTFQWLAPPVERGVVAASESASPQLLLARIEKGEHSAFAELEGLLRSSRAQRSSFQLRLELAGALERAGNRPQATQVYMGLLRDIDEYHLERWEPELATRVLLPLSKLLTTRDGPSVHPDTAVICARLAQLSPTALL